MAGRFASKVIVVVGATRGIGAATSRRLAQEGATVIMGGISTERGRAFDPCRALIRLHTSDRTRCLWAPCFTLSPNNTGRAFRAAPIGRWS